MVKKYVYIKFVDGKIEDSAALLESPFKITSLKYQDIEKRGKSTTTRILIYHIKYPEATQKSSKKVVIIDTENYFLLSYANPNRFTFTEVLKGDKVYDNFGEF